MAIQIFRPKFEVEECLSEIKECLEKGWTGIGFKTTEFEKKWKEYTGLSNAYFTNSATGALNLAVNILKEDGMWQDGDEIITTPLTFVSSNHAILKSNMKAVFADIDDTLCLNPESVRERITDKTRAIMFVGVGGNIGHYYEIVEICKEFRLKLILDAAHMAGTRVKGKIPGTEADAVVYSFHAVKNLPTADSGMLCFKENRLDGIARKKGWLGINKDTYLRTTDKGTYKWRYDVEYVGEKIHGNSVIAAIALVQLRYLERDNAFRRQIGQWYKDLLEPIGERIGFIHIPEGCTYSSHLFPILVEDRDSLLEYLNEKDIYPGVHYQENTIYKMYQYAQSTCPYAEYVSSHILSLPLHLELTYEDVTYISEAIKEFFNEKKAEC